jgi:hypothetical protein
LPGSCPISMGISDSFPETPTRGAESNLKFFFRYYREKLMKSY